MRQGEQRESMFKLSSSRMTIKKSLEDTSWGADQRTHFLLIPLFARKKPSRVRGVCFAGESSMSLEFGILVELSARRGRLPFRVVNISQHYLGIVFHGRECALLCQAKAERVKRNRA